MNYFWKTQSQVPFKVSNLGSVSNNKGVRRDQNQLGPTLSTKNYLFLFKFFWSMSIIMIKTNEKKYK